MAWIKKTVNGMLVAEETITLPSTGTGYTSEINFLKPTNSATKYVGLVCTASAVSGTNLDVSLNGTWTSGGTKVVLVDAPGGIEDITNTAKTKSSIFNLNAYPAPYYYIGFTVDTDESSNTVTVRLVLPTQ